MLYYDRIDISKGIDVDKTYESKMCVICLYWYFLNKRFKFKSYLCNRCHHSLMISVNFSDTAILKIKNADYCCIINKISKSEAINSMENIDLTEKCGTLKEHKTLFRENIRRNFL